MIIDNEKHRQMLLQILASIQIQGEHIDDFYELKKAVQNAEIKGEKPQ